MSQGQSLQGNVISPAQFARELVERLLPILPSGFDAHAEGANVHVGPSGGIGASTSLAQLDPDDSNPDDYADAAWNVLSLAQDVVSETTAEPWPAAVGAARDLAEPGTRVHGDSIEMYFGGEEQPVLTLPPILLEG